MPKGYRLQYLSRDSGHYRFDNSAPSDIRWGVRRGLQSLRLPSASEDQHENNTTGLIMLDAAPVKENTGTRHMKQFYDTQRVSV